MHASLPCSLSTCTGGLLRRLTRRTTTFYERWLRREGLTLPQYALLQQLDETPRPLGELADLLEMDRSTLTRSLKPMLEQGWAKESRGRDARQHLFAISPAGLDKRRQAHAVWAEAQLALEQRLGSDAVATLHRQLQQALQALHPPSPREPR